jgi:hypothetical protein
MGLGQPTSGKGPCSGPPNQKSGPDAFSRKPGVCLGFDSKRAASDYPSAGGGSQPTRGAPADAPPERSPVVDEAAEDRLRLARLLLFLGRVGLGRFSSKLEKKRDTRDRRNTRKRR